jgi:hypothetical protein
MPDVARSIDQRAGAPFDHRLPELKANLPVEDDEELVLFAVDVERCGNALRRHELDHGESPFGLLCSYLHEDEGAVEPQCLALIRAKPIALGGLWKPLAFHDVSE